MRAESRGEDRRGEERDRTLWTLWTLWTLAISLFGQSLSIRINKVSGDFKDMKLMLNHHVLFDLRMTIAYVFFVTLLSITYCSNTGLIPSLN